MRDGDVFVMCYKVVAPIRETRGFIVNSTCIGAGTWCGTCDVCGRGGRGG